MANETTSFFRQVRANMRTYTMFITLLLIWILFGSLTHWVFLSPRNLSNLFRQMSIISFLATGMVLVIVTGNIDLSVGSVTGIVSAIAAKIQLDIFPTLLPKLFPALQSPSIGILSTVLTITITMGIAVLIGVWQGAIIAYLRVPAFIVTLGGLTIFRGGVLGVTQGKTLMPIEDSLRLIAQGYLPNSVGLIIALAAAVLVFYSTIRGRVKKRQYGVAPPPAVNDLTRAFFLSAVVVGFVVVMNLYRGLQVPVLLLAITAIIMSYVTNNTRFGRYAYAIGGNREATRLSGINIKKNEFLIFVLMGALCGVAGIVLTGYVAAGTIGAGSGYELDTIASCILGGTSTLGGSGTVAGAMIGSLIMASLTNGMSVMNMDIFWQYIIKGLVLVFAVLLDVSAKKGK